MIHVMSITKAAIGLMYHIHEEEYPRRKKAFNNISIGQALSMTTGYRNVFNFEEYRAAVESNKSLLTYSKDKIVTGECCGRWIYNDLAYQILASNMKDVADKFGVFMGDKASELKSDGFKHGKGWKWEHTKDGEPLGPHGLWMTPDTAKKFGEKASEHVLEMSKSERVDMVQGEWQGIGSDVFKRYWNGWFFNNDQTNAYAVGYVVQVIALTPKGVYTQLYEEDWNDKLHEKREDVRWKFVNNIENPFKF